MKSRLILGLATATGLATASGAALALTTDEAVTIATDSYVYGYSLITTEVTRVQMSNVSEPRPAEFKAPTGMFNNVPK